MADAALLHARGLVKAYAGTKVLDEVDLAVPRGSVVALLGASGSGKTTLLQIIAGLVAPDAGTLTIDGADMHGVAAFDRPVNMVFQSYALFPHLSVADNIAYGLKARGAPRRERERAVQAALELVRLDGFGTRRPEQLSGGQRQRVALARCLVLKPAVLLLDEPMAALDRNLRADVQRELISIQRRVGATFVLVTHDQDEAMAMSDYLAVMDRGRIVQFGPPREVYERPATRFVASFLGTINLFDGLTARAGEPRPTLGTPDGLGIVLAPPAAIAAGSPATVGVRPERLTLSRRPTGLANDFPGTLEQLSYCGNLSAAVVRLASGRTLAVTIVNAQSDAATLRPGEAVHVGFAPDAVVALTE